MSTIEAAREINERVAQTWMTSMGEPAWWDLMHEDIVLEFPYATSLGQADRVVGKAAAIAYVKALLDRAGRINFRDLQILGTTDPELFVSEYQADRRNRHGAPYVQTYINKVRVRDGKVIFMREFWDPKRIVDSGVVS
jgi:ketosteroid isomerase-like protein